MCTKNLGWTWDYRPSCFYVILNLWQFEFYVFELSLNCHLRTYQECKKFSFCINFVQKPGNIFIFFVTQQLIGQAIVTAARELHDETCSDEEFTLTIPFIHVAYDCIEKRLTNFCQLVQAQSDIVTSLREVIPPRETEMVSFLLVLKSNPSIENFMRLKSTL